jgi:hypothetical protein
MAHCPYCSTPIEWETNIGDLKLQDVSEIEPAKNLFLESDGFHIDFRLPNSFDIMNAMSNPVQAESISTFISGCILHVQLNQKDFKSEELPPNIIEKIDQHMAEADPQADIKMVLSCPDCNKHWEAPFDIMSYLRMEIDSWAKRLLKEVALLARAFSWSETDILNLSLHRRRLYLEMIS